MRLKAGESSSSAESVHCSVLWGGVRGVQVSALTEGAPLTTAVGTETTADPPETETAPRSTECSREEDSILMSWELFRAELAHSSVMTEPCSSLGLYMAAWGSSSVFDTSTGSSGWVA